MYRLVTKEMFYGAFKGFGRAKQFSYEALGALYDYYTEQEDDTVNDVGVQLDVIGICCEWGEYDTIEEALSEYGLETLEELKNAHHIIEIETGSVLVSQ